MSIIGDISLYFHIPFCRRKCPYCNFYTTTIKNEDAYLNALLLEIIKYKNILTTNNIISIYFGGGSPWLFGEKNLSIILETLKKNFKISKNCEITIELNPEDIKSPTDALSLKNINVNRVSLGVQAFNDSILKKLGRSHTLSHSINAISFISKYIKNISIDLMYDIPYQTLPIWKENFNIIESHNLPIQHISIYNLTIEKNTSFYSKKQKIINKMPSENTSTQMLLLAIEKLKELDFNHYEISAFAKKNKIGIHNLGYWTGRPFIGFGPSAFSYFKNKRYKNISNLSLYIKALTSNNSSIDFEEHLTFPTNINELLILNLRLIQQGVNLNDFEKKFNVTLTTQTKKNIEKLINENLLIKKNNILALTQKGFLFYNHIASTLI